MSFNFIKERAEKEAEAQSSAFSFVRKIAEDQAASAPAPGAIPAYDYDYLREVEGQNRGLSGSYKSVFDLGDAMTSGMDAMLDLASMVGDFGHTIQSHLPFVPDDRKKPSEYIDSLPGREVLDYAGERRAAKVEAAREDLPNARGLAFATEMVADPAMAVSAPAKAAGLGLIGAKMFLSTKTVGKLSMSERIQRAFLSSNIVGPEVRQTINHNAGLMSHIDETWQNARKSYEAAISKLPAGDAVAGNTAVEDFVSGGVPLSAVPDELKGFATYFRGSIDQAMNASVESLEAIGNLKHAEIADLGAAKSAALEAFETRWFTRGMKISDEGPGSSPVTLGAETVYLEPEDFQAVTRYIGHKSGAEPSQDAIMAFFEEAASKRKAPYLPGLDRDVKPLAHYRDFRNSDEFGALVDDIAKRGNHDPEEVVKIVDRLASTPGLYARTIKSKPAKGKTNAKGEPEFDILETRKQSGMTLPEIIEADRKLHKSISGGHSSPYSAVDGFARTYTLIASRAANTQLATRLRQHADELRWTADRGKIDTPLSTQSAATGSSSITDPANTTTRVLNTGYDDEVFVTKAIADALEGMTIDPAQNYGRIAKAGAAWRVVATILNPPGALRNAYSGGQLYSKTGLLTTLTRTMQGRGNTARGFRIGSKRLRHSSKATAPARAPAIPAGAMAKSLDTIDDDTLFDLAVRTQVINDSARYGEFKESARSLEDIFSMGGVGEAFSSTKAQVVDAASRLYQLGDDVAKSVKWLDEMDFEVALAKARGADDSLEKVAYRAAETVKRQMPSYSQSPDIVKELRRSVLISPFPTFTSEVVRNSANTLVDTIKLFKSGIAEGGMATEAGRLQILRGADNIASIVTAAFMPKFVTQAVRHIAQDAEVFEEDYTSYAKEIVPDWMRDSKSGVLSVNKAEGKFYMVDMSNVDAFDPLQKLLAGAMRTGGAMTDGDLHQAALEAAHSIWDVHLGMDPISTTFVLGMLNGAERGGEVAGLTKHSMWSEEWSAAFAKEMGGNYANQAFRSMSDLITGSKSAEMPKPFQLMNLAGMATREYDVYKLAKTLSFDIRNRHSAIRDDIKSVLRRPNLSPSERARAIGEGQAKYDEANEFYKQKIELMLKFAPDGRQGRAKIINSLNSSKQISRKLAEDILDGRTGRVWDYEDDSKLRESLREGNRPQDNEPRSTYRPFKI